MTVTTRDTLLASVRQYLYGGETRDERDRVAQAVTLDATEIHLRYSRPGIAPGATLSIRNEDLYVWEVVGSVATVSRGENGTVPAVYNADEDIHINPRFSAGRILHAMDEEMAALPDKGVFNPSVAVPFTYEPGTDSYRIVSAFYDQLLGDTFVLDILEVRYEAADGSGRWHVVPPSLYRLERSTASQDAYIVFNTHLDPGASVKVIYAAPFQSYTLTDVATGAPPTDVPQELMLGLLGLREAAVDIVALGAAVRLIAGAEVPRLALIQGDTRRADEVAPGSRSGAWRNLMAMHRMRVDETRARLYQMYPRMR